MKQVWRIQIATILCMLFQPSTSSFLMQPSPGIHMLRAKLPQPMLLPFPVTPPLIIPHNITPLPLPLPPPPPPPPHVPQAPSTIPTPSALASHSQTQTVTAVVKPVKLKSPKRKSSSIDDNEIEEMISEKNSEKEHERKLADILPKVTFDCHGRSEGYYADVSFRCEVFHYCGKPDGKRFTFFCPPGSRFNQIHMICDYDMFQGCDNSQDYFHLNDNLYPKDNQTIQKTISQSHVNTVPIQRTVTLDPLPPPPPSSSSPPPIVRTTTRTIVKSQSQKPKPQKTKPEDSAHLKPKHRQEEDAEEDPPPAASRRQSPPMKHLIPIRNKPMIHRMNPRFHAYAKTGKGPFFFRPPFAGPFPPPNLQAMGSHRPPPHVIMNPPVSLLHRMHNSKKPSLPPSLMAPQMVPPARHHHPQPPFQFGLAIRHPRPSERSGPDYEYDGDYRDEGFPGVPVPRSHSHHPRHRRPEPSGHHRQYPPSREFRRRPLPPPELMMDYDEPQMLPEALPRVDLREALRERSQQGPPLQPSWATEWAEDEWRRGKALIDEMEEEDDDERNVRQSHHRGDEVDAFIRRPVDDEHVRGHGLGRERQSSEGTKRKKSSHGSKSKQHRKHKTSTTGRSAISDESNELETTTPGQFKRTTTLAVPRRRKTSTTTPRPTTTRTTTTTTTTTTTAAPRRRRVKKKKSTTTTTLPPSPEPAELSPTHATIAPEATTFLTRPVIRKRVQTSSIGGRVNNRPSATTKKFYSTTSTSSTSPQTSPPEVPTVVPVIATVVTDATEVIPMASMPVFSRTSYWPSKVQRSRIKTTTSTPTSLTASPVTSSSTDTARVFMANVAPPTTNKTFETIGTPAAQISNKEYSDDVDEKSYV